MLAYNPSLKIYQTFDQDVFSKALREHCGLRPVREGEIPTEPVQKALQSTTIPSKQSYQLACQDHTIFVAMTRRERLFRDAESHTIQTRFRSVLVLSTLRYFSIMSVLS